MAILGAAAVLGALSALAAPTALANSQTYTGGDCTTPGGCTGNNFGGLMLPATVTFSDNPLSAGTTVDQWFFMVPNATVSGTVAGDQIDLSNFSVQGTVDAFALYAVGDSTPIASGTISGQFSQVILDPSIAAGNYYLQVQSTVAAGAVGNYSGTLVAAAPVPLPAALWLLASALGSLGVTLLSRASGVNRWGPIS